MPKRAKPYHWGLKKFQRSKLPYDGGFLAHRKVEHLGRPELEGLGLGRVSKPQPPIRAALPELLDE